MSPGQVPASGDWGRDLGFPEGLHVRPEPDPPGWRCLPLSSGRGRVSVQGSAHAWCARSSVGVRRGHVRLCVYLSVPTPCVHVCMSLVGRCASVDVHGGHLRLCILHIRVQACVQSRVSGSLSACMCVCLLRGGAQRRVMSGGRGPSRGWAARVRPSRPSLSCCPSPGPGCHPGSGLPRAWPWPSPQRPLLPLGLHARSHRAEQRAEQQRGAPGWVVGGWRWGGRAVRPQAGAWAHGSTGTALAGPRLHSSTQAPVGLREAAGFFLLGNPGRSARPPGRPEASWTFLRGGMSEAPARSLKAVSPPELTACGGLRLGAGHSRCAPATEKGLRSSPHHADQGHPTCCSPRRADPGPYWLCGGVGGFPPRTVRRSQDSPPKQDRSL